MIYFHPLGRHCRHCRPYLTPTSSGCSGVPVRGVPVQPERHTAVCLTKNGEMEPCGDLGNGNHGTVRKSLDYY